MQVNVCGECGVPEYVSSEHLWLDCGLIAQKRDRRHVVVFIESDNLDPLFKGIEGIIGASIERIVLTTRRRAGRAYMARMVPVGVREMLQRGELELGAIFGAFAVIGTALGYGGFELLEYRYEQDDGDYALVRVEKPYSTVFGLCDPAAAMEALTGYELGFEHRKVGENAYEVRIFRSSHPEEYKDRLIMRPYTHGEGDIVFETCPSCGVPREISAFEWDLENGVITAPVRRRRMAFFAPTVIDAIFDELEKELGETIPETVVEAQRRFVKSGMYSPREMDDAEAFRKQLALRGLGDLREFEMGAGGLRMRLDNAAIHLMVVGLVQGIYEMAYDTASAVEWDLSPEGDLEMEVKPRA